MKSVRQPRLEADDDGGRPFNTTRTEAFSDGVFAIAITLLVLDLVVPAHAAGDLAGALLGLWSAYVAFLGSFIYVGVMWLNHHAAFRRIRSVDRALNWANLGVLLGAVVLPFPTAVVAQAFHSGNTRDEQAAVALYGFIGMLMAASWGLFFHTLHRRRHLAHQTVDPDTFRTERWRALPGVGGYAAAAIAGVLINPAIALGFFVLLPVFYGITSEGARTRKNLPSSHRWGRGRTDPEQADAADAGADAADTPARAR